MKRTIGTSTLELLCGDITTLAVDAIVNAANEYLLHGGGVALAIVQKGGPQIQIESNALVARRGPLAPGEAVLTGAGNLPAKHIIHTVGPVWGAVPEETADALLCAAVRNSAALADHHALKTIAFPALSTGIFGFPVDRAAPLMVSAAAQYLAGRTQLVRLIICLYDKPTYRVFAAALK